MSAYKCNLILAGFGKSGTSSLHTYLALHPNIVMSRIKEPHYFSVEEQWARGSDFHNSLFFPTEKNDVAYFGESSTTYSASEVALKRIKAQLDNPKIMFIVRDPVERVVSHYRWMYALGLEKCSILEALKKNGVGFDPNNSLEGNYKSYLQFSAYSKYLPMWQAEFGEDNVHVLFTDELAKSPQAVLNHCFEFLKIPPMNNLTETIENKTENSSRVALRSLAKAVNKFVPQNVKQGIKSIPLIYTAWKAATRYKVSIKPPTISSNEIGAITSILSDEIAYYKKLRTDHSLFD